MSSYQTLTRESQVIFNLASRERGDLRTVSLSKLLQTRLSDPLTAVALSYFLPFNHLGFVSSG